MSPVDGFYMLGVVVMGVVLFALWRGDQVKTGFRIPGVQLFLSYRRDGSKQPASDGRLSTGPLDRQR